LDTSGYVIEPLHQPTAVPPEPKVSTKTSKVGMQIFAGYCPICKRVVDFIREKGSISSDDWHCEYCQEKMPV